VAALEHSSAYEEGAADWKAQGVVFRANEAIDDEARLIVL